MIGDDFTEDDIPAFLKTKTAESIVDELGDDDDFDFPSLEDDIDIVGLMEDEPADPGPPKHEPPKPEPEAPKPAPKKKETKADKQAKLAKPAGQPKAEEPENPRAKPGNNNGIVADQLRSYIERIERLEEEKKGIADDIKDVKAEAKGCGYDGKIIAKVLKLRKQDKAERDEEEALLHMYLFALNME